MASTLNLYDCETLTPFRFQAPFTAFCAGATQSGKSTFWKKICQERLIEPFPSRIQWHFPAGTEQSLHDELLQTVPNLSLRIGLPDFNDGEFIRNCHDTLLIIDDLLFEINNKDMGLAKFFSIHSHHSACSVVLLTQTLFFDNKQFRLAALNTRYLILFKSHRFAAQISLLARQISTVCHNLASAYHSCISQPHKPFAYLIVDLTCNCPEKGRLRSDIFCRDLFNSVYL